MKRLILSLVSLVLGIWLCLYIFSCSATEMLTQESIQKIENINDDVTGTAKLTHQGNEGDIILQAFAWRSQWNGQFGQWYNGISNMALQLSNDGFTVLWFPPPGKTIRSNLGDHGDYTSACGYMPLDYRDYGLYQQWVMDGGTKTWYQHASTKTLYGSVSELRACISNLHRKGIKVLADVVINHRAGRQTNGQGEWCCWGDNLGQVSSGYMVWGKNDNNPQQILNESGGSGGYEGTWSYGGRTYNNQSTGYASEISHWNSAARSDILAYVLDLKNYCGFDGMRMDMVKGYDPYYVGMYSDYMGSYMTVGEWYEYNNPQALYDYVNRTGQSTEYASANDGKSLVFDFYLKGTLTMAVKNQDFSGLNGIVFGWPRAAVTFVDNHDTGQSAGGVGQAHNPIEDGVNDMRNRIQAYAIILSHPGIPCVYWYHYNDCGSELKTFITNMIKWRKSEGIIATSIYKLYSKGNGYYSAYITNNVAGQGLCIAVGTGNTWSGPGTGWTQVYNNYYTRIWRKD